MTDDLLNPNTNAKIYAISEIAGAVKRTLEDRFGHVRVQGEVSRVTHHRNGHIYFTVKDANAALDCVIWRGVAGRLQVRPEEGSELVLTGKVSSYPASSRYQMIVERVELAGLGALLAKLEALKAKLGAEGLFAPERKRPLPAFPRHVGVITSPTGAVIRDILHRIRDRFPTHVMVWPVNVQGAGAAQGVAQAIQGFNALPAHGPIPRPDVLIVARGGGSVEDLWPFNDEALVRVAAASGIPLISAVGHETDTTLIDYAADVRAPTPTAAAEVATPIRADLEAMLADAQARLRRAQHQTFESARHRLSLAKRGLPSLDQLMGTVRQRLDTVSLRLDSALQTRTHQARHRLSETAGRLHPHLLRTRLSTHRQSLDSLAHRQGRGLAQAVQNQRQHLGQLSRALANPATWRGGARLRHQHLETMARRLARALPPLVQTPKDQLARWGRMLEVLSYKNTLARGYAVVRDQNGAVVRVGRGLTTGQTVQIGFADGDRKAVIE